MNNPEIFILPLPPLGITNLYEYYHAHYYKSNCSCNIFNIWAYCSGCNCIIPFGFPDDNVSALVNTCKQMNNIKLPKFSMPRALMTIHDSRVAINCYLWSVISPEYKGFNKALDYLKSETPEAFPNDLNNIESWGNNHGV